MSSREPDVSPEDRLNLDMSDTERSPDDQADDRLRRAKWLIALAGIAAGLVAFGIGEAVYGLIPTGKEEVNTMGHLLMLPTMKTTNLADTRNGR